MFFLITEIKKVVSQSFIQKVVQLHIKHPFACWSWIPIFYIKTSQFSNTGRETLVFYDGLPELTPRAYRGWGWVCTGDVKRCEDVRLPYFWRTTRINSFTENSRTTWEIEMKLCPSQQINLGTFLGQNHILSIVSAHVQMTQVRTWPHFTDLLKYLAFDIDFLVYKVGDMLRPWNFLKNVFWKKTWSVTPLLIFAVVTRNWFLVCIVHTSHVT